MILLKDILVEILRDLKEDWMFEPQNFGIMPTSTQGHVKQKDSAVPKYKKTTDAGVKKAKKMTKKYHKRNRAGYRSDASPIDRERIHTAP